MICVCGSEFDPKARRGQPGKANECEDCAEENKDVQRYTGVQIFSHKCGSDIQINTDPALTNYINNSTKLKNKGSNMNANVIASSKMSNKTSGACHKMADAFSYKNRDE